MAFTYTSIRLKNVGRFDPGFVITGASDRGGAGTSVASAGDINGDGFGDLIVGAPKANRAYVVFDQSGGSPARVDLADIAVGQGGFVIRGEDADDRFAYSVASAGDINGDGFDDLIVGADRADAAGNAKNDAGAAYVVFGKAGGFAASIDLAAVAQGTGGFVIQGEDSGDRAGRSVAAEGDLNGDGFDDLIVGAPGADAAGNAKRGAGAGYVVFGKASGFGAAIDLTQVAQGQGGFAIQGENAGDSAGGSVASAGDLNGDGFDDLIVGAYLADAAGDAKDSAGAAYVVFGKASGFGASIDLAGVALGQGGFVIQGQDGGDQAGFSAARAGDVNGDGFDDLIIGARFADGAGNATSYSGAAYVVFGTAAAFPASIDLAAIALNQGGFVINGGDTYGHAGFSVAAAGDVNGDGVDDLLIGEPLGDVLDAEFASGTAYLVFGTAGGFDAPLDLDDVALGIGGFALLGATSQNYAGTSVAAAGDLNNDGFDDVIIGAPGARTDSGAAYVLYGEDFRGPPTVATLAVDGAGLAATEGTGGVTALTFTVNRSGALDTAVSVNYATFGNDVSLRDFANGVLPTGRISFAANELTKTITILIVADRELEADERFIVVLSDPSPGTIIDPARGGAQAVILNDDPQTITGTAAAENLRGAALAETILALSGNDLVSGVGGNDVLDGGDGNDWLRGGAGDDTLLGGMGADSLVGGGGDDVMTGRGGSDVFVFNKRQDGVDTITDFNAAFDLISVDASGFGGGLVAGALATANFVANAAGVVTGAAAQFVYDTDSGALFWDRDGSGAATAVQIALLNGAPTLEATDFVVVA